MESNERRYTYAKTLDEHPNYFIFYEKNVVCSQKIIATSHRFSKCACNDKITVENRYKQSTMDDACTSLHVIEEKFATARCQLIDAFAKFYLFVFIS